MCSLYGSAVKDGGGVPAASNRVLDDCGTGELIDIKSSESFLTAPPIRKPEEKRPNTPLSSFITESPFFKLVEAPSCSPASPSTYNLKGCVQYAVFNELTAPYLKTITV